MVHGALESDVEMRLIEVLPVLAEQAGPRVSGQGGNDYVTYIFAPLQAAAAATFEVEVRAIAPPWWRILPSLYRTVKTHGRRHRPGTGDAISRAWCALCATPPHDNSDLPVSVEGKSCSCR